VTLKPPAIRGKIPEGYSGPIFYRLTNFDALMCGGMPDIFSVLPSERKRKDKIFLHASREKWNLRSSGLLMDAEGKLLPEWEAPFKARVSQKSEASGIEFVPQYISQISERIHDHLEEIEPGRHMFLPVDAERPDGSISRFYYLFKDNATIFCPLNSKANNLEFRPSRDGTYLVYSTPDWLGGTREHYATEHFGYLDADRVIGRHFFYAGDTSSVFSEELLFRIGGVFPKWCNFVPMGVK
jgi:hypothetical protein